MRARTTPRATPVAPAAAPPPKKRTSRGRGIATMLPVAIGLATAALPNSRKPAPPVVETASPSPSARLRHPAGKMFDPGCPLPFPGVLNPDSDDRCSIDGDGTDKPKIAESEAKNNFGASTRSRLDVTYDELIDLQAKSVNVPKSPPDRSVLASIPGTRLGEGKYVSYIAYIMKAHNSKSGEAVNCHLKTDAATDIHIVLVNRPDQTDECASTTAEMTPHFRPETWTAANLEATRGRPVRVRGQLFFDGSHSPCTASSRPTPNRASLWEIHPVYSLDVCSAKTLDQCTESSTNWVDLTEWASPEEKD